MNLATVIRVYDTDAIVHIEKWPPRQFGSKFLTPFGQSRSFESKSNAVPGVVLRGLGVGHQAAVAPAVVMLSAVVEPGAEAQLLIVTGEPGPGLLKMFSSCYV